MSRRAEVVQVRRGSNNRNSDPHEAYTAARPQAYPSTYLEKHVSSAEKQDYDDYSVLTKIANASGDDDLSRKEQAYQDCRSGKDEKKVVKVQNVEGNVYFSAEEYYYEQRTQGIYPSQHTPLIEPARIAHETNHRMADARRDYLQTHPYGYTNYWQAERHAGKRDNAYRDAAAFRANHDDHARYAA
ncbi:hypothetical protein MMC11_008549 [Xylographa trunciseda]|nr:hypothetical protein [Xylographa trunciseda]